MKELAKTKEWKKKKGQNKRKASKPAPSLANKINSSAALSTAFDTKSELWLKN